MDQTHDPQEIGARLWLSARAHAARWGYSFGLGATSVLIERCQTAGQEIAMRGTGDAQRETLIRQTEAALGVLIEHMIRAANEDPAYAQAHPKTIGEETMARAMSAFCPCWPIC